MLFRVRKRVCKPKGKDTQEKGERETEPGPWEKKEEKEDPGTPPTRENIRVEVAYIGYRGAPMANHSVELSGHVLKGVLMALVQLVTAAR